MTNLRGLPKKEVRSRNKIEQHEHEDQADARRVTLVDQVGDFIDSSNRLPVDAIISIDTVDTPLIYNVSAASANTEYSQVLPDHTKKLKIRVREPQAALIKFAFVAAQSGTNYFTVKPGSVYDESGIDLVGKTVYFQVTKPNLIVEFLIWT